MEKAIYTSPDKGNDDVKELNEHLEDGWTVKASYPQSVSSSGNGYSKMGGFLVILEKQPSLDAL